MATDKELEQAALHKEIDLIQSCISRMADNSFKIKGWLVALITAVLAFGDKFAALKYLCTVLIFPVIALWYLDAFFLHAEKKYRKMYAWVINNRQNSNEYLYDLDPNRHELTPDRSIVGIMFSTTLWPFYCIPLVILLIIVFLSYDILPICKGA